MKSKFWSRVILFLIISNEFCERYTFYGIRSVLFAFLINYYHLAPAKATWFVHGFVFMCYLFSVVGGALADGVFGRYRTIVYFNLLYAAGNILLCLCSMEHNMLFLLGGLLLVSIGTGGIKPCISAFGGDQARNTKSKRVDLFFTVFYFFINTGSLAGILASSVLASGPCSAGSPCYFNAFLAATLLHLTSVALFLMGTKLYHSEKPNIDNLNIMIDTLKGLFGQNIRGILLPLFSGSRFRGRAGDAKSTNAFAKNLCRKRDAKSPMGAEQVRDAACLAEILSVFGFVSFFWMLFDQQSSSWIEQGMHMDSSVRFFSRRFMVFPSQMQALNAATIVAAIPLFANIVYPLLKKAGAKLLPLKKMYAGLFLASLSFFVSGSLELMLQRGRKLSILWQTPQYVLMTAGEVLVSITGLEFAYTQSPESTRSFVSAAWLASTALGNLLILVFASLNPLLIIAPGYSRRFCNQLFFGTIALLADLAFILRTKSFKYQGSNEGVVRPLPDSPR